VQAYLDAALAEYVPLATEARFFSQNGVRPLPVRLESFSPVREQVLRDSGLLLSEGGTIPVVADAQGRMFIEGSYYLLTARAAESAPRLGEGQTGTLWFWSRGRSYLFAAGRNLWRIILRESGL